MEGEKNLLVALATKPSLTHGYQGVAKKSCELSAPAQSIFLFQFYLVIEFCTTEVPGRKVLYKTCTGWSITVLQLDVIQRSTHNGNYKNTL